LEPPASSRKPKRPKDTPDETPEGDTPAKPRSKASTPTSGSSKAKPAPKPRAKKPDESDRPIDATPMVKPGAGLPSATKTPPEPEAEPATRDIPGLSSRQPGASTATPARPKPTPTGSSKESVGDRLVGLSRTAAIRNMEVGRKYGRQAADATRRAVGNVSSQISKRVAGARGREINTGDISKRASDISRRAGESLDRGFNYAQRRLEESDTAVIAFTLALVIACIVLTALVVTVSRR
jgi:hypothetical protein